MANYFYLDEYGIVHGTKDKATAAKHGKVIESDVECMAPNKDGDMTGGFPLFFSKLKFRNDVYIYIKEQKVFINENIKTGHNVGIKDLPANIQKLAKDFGYTQG